MVYALIPGVGMQHRLRYSHIFSKGLTSPLLLFCFLLHYIVIICSPLHALHVLMDSSPFELVDHLFGFHCQGLPRGVLAAYF